MYILLAATSTPETPKPQCSIFFSQLLFLHIESRWIKTEKTLTASAPTHTASVSTEQDKNKAGKAVSVTVYVLFANTTWRLADNVLN